MAGRGFNIAGAAGSVEWGGAAESRGCTTWGLALEGLGRGSSSGVWALASDCLTRNARVTTK